MGSKDLNATTTLGVASATRASPLGAVASELSRDSEGIDLLSDSLLLWAQLCRRDY